MTISPRRAKYTTVGTKGGADDATELMGGELELLLKLRTGFNRKGLRRARGWSTQSRALCFCPIK